MTHYDFNGLYCPKAADFIPQSGNADVAGFLEACCVRLERIAPGVAQVASLVGQMRQFASKAKIVKTADDEPDIEDEMEMEAECARLEDELSDAESQFDLSLPE